MQSFDVIIPYSRKHPDWETAKAETLFNSFLRSGFSYNSLSAKPDYLAYASAEFLVEILPLIIDEMLLRNNTDNFLIYPMLTAIDTECKTVNPATKGQPLWIEDDIYQERARTLVSLAPPFLIEKICKFLVVLRADPPIPSGRLERLLKFWHEKKGITWLSTIDPNSILDDDDNDD